jgi:hypothetical protein
LFHVTLIFIFLIMLYTCAITFFLLGDLRGQEGAGGEGLGIAVMGECIFEETNLISEL